MSEPALVDTSETSANFRIRLSDPGHLFNSQVLMSHLSDDLTLIPTLFFVWFVSTGLYLALGGRAVEI